MKFNRIRYLPIGRGRGVVKTPRPLFFASSDLNRYFDKRYRYIPQGLDIDALHNTNATVHFSLEQQGLSQATALVY